MEKPRLFREIFADTLYQAFDMLRAFLHYVFIRKQYRVTYEANDGYPSLQHYEEEFFADNDQIAKRYARTFSKGNPFHLEQIRTVKAK